jgi:hypothetical protein
VGEHHPLHQPEVVVLIAQVDDNDDYELYYWDLSRNSWKLLWYIPNYNIYNGSDLWGMQTRPNPYDNSERYMLSSPIVTNALMLKGDMFNSDRDSVNYFV